MQNYCVMSDKLASQIDFISTSLLQRHSLGVSLLKRIFIKAPPPNHPSTQPNHLSLMCLETSWNIAKLLKLLQMKNLSITEIVQKPKCIIGLNKSTQHVQLWLNNNHHFVSYQTTSIRQDYLNQFNSNHLLCIGSKKTFFHNFEKSASVVIFSYSQLMKTGV